MNQRLALVLMSCLATWVVVYPTGLLAQVQDPFDSAQQVTAHDSSIALSNGLRVVVITNGPADMAEVTIALDNPMAWTPPELRGMEDLALTIMGSRLTRSLDSLSAGSMRPNMAWRSLKWGAGFSTYVEAEKILQALTSLAAVLDVGEIQGDEYVPAIADSMESLLSLRGGVCHHPRFSESILLGLPRYGQVTAGPFSISRVRLGDLRQLMTRMLAPDHAVLLVRTGPQTPDPLPQIRALFSGWTAGDATDEEDAPLPRQSPKAVFVRMGSQSPESSSFQVAVPWSVERKQELLVLRWLLAAIDNGLIESSSRNFSTRVSPIVDLASCRLDLLFQHRNDEWMTRGELTDTMSAHWAAVAEEFGETLQELPASALEPRGRDNDLDVFARVCLERTRSGEAWPAVAERPAPETVGRILEGPRWHDARSIASLPCDETEASATELMALGFEEAASLSPEGLSSSAALSSYFLATRKLNAQKIEPALRDARELVASAGESPFSHLVLAQALALDERPEDALREFDQAHAINPQLPAAIVQAVELEMEEMGDARAALFRLQPLLDLAPNWPRSRALEAHILAALGRKTEARQALEEWVRRSPASKEAWEIYTAFLLDELGEPETAAQVLFDAAQSGERPLTAGLAELLARALYSIEPRERALSLLKGVTLANPTQEASFWQMAGDALSEAANGPEEAELAVAVFEKLVATMPDNLVFLLDLGGALESARHGQDAAAVLQKAIRIDPRNAASWRMLGDVQYGLLKDDPAAQSSFEESLRLYDSSVPAWAGLGLCLERMKQGDEALEAFTRALALRPRYAWAERHRGRVYQFLLDRPSAAEAAYRRALEIDKEDDRAWALLGDLLRQQGRFSEAIKALEAAVTLDPGYGWAWDRLVDAFAASEGPTRALACCREAIAHAEGDEKLAERLNNSAWFIATRAGTASRELLLEALDQARKACLLVDRSNSNYLDTLAELYFQLEETADAVTVIDEAMTLEDANLEYLAKQRRKFLGAPDPQGS